MRYFFLFFLVIGLSRSPVYGQTGNDESLKAILAKKARDTSDVNYLVDAANMVSFASPDSAVFLANKALESARELHYTKGQGDALNISGQAYYFLGEQAEALKMLFEALAINRALKDRQGEAITQSYIGLVYADLGQYRQAIQSTNASYEILHQRQQPAAFELSNIGEYYYMLNMPDSAYYYARRAYEEFQAHPYGVHLKGLVLRQVGDAYALTGKTDSALLFYDQAIRWMTELDDKLNMCAAQLKVAGLFLELRRYDSSLYYAKKCFENARFSNARKFVLESSHFIARLFRQFERPDSAYYYLDISVRMRDSIYGPEKNRQMQLLLLSEQQKQESTLRRQERYQTRVKMTVLMAGLAVVLLLAFILWRNNRHRRKANGLLLQEKQKVENAFEELQSTQAQLVQSEKMASLGSLTAGIAHEIQNPLNFVNNFSEINRDLIEELRGERRKAEGVRDTRLEEELLNDIAQNEEKITHHGKRADAIVKNMLQHSRSSSGQKEPTDINALCDEYLRLSYHGLRAKDNSFQANMEVSFDDSIGKINVVPQDIGRVLLNLINNAFYACTPQPPKGGVLDSGNSFTPTIWVSTKKSANQVLISVRDNGPGIPHTILDKIFQPFFTTKPTGQGTGLGLSLSYDIVKAHGGEIKVETKEGEGSVFTIVLPG